MVRLIRIAVDLGVRKLRMTGGEPLVRSDLCELLAEIRSDRRIEEIGLSTNGTLLTQRKNGLSYAERLLRSGVQNLNISLDSLEAGHYSRITGRDLLPRVLEGIQEAKRLNFSSIKLNAVLVRGSSEDQIVPLLAFARKEGLLLRFIELMPVSTSEVLDDANFLPIAQALRIIEEACGPLDSNAEFRTNGPASYYTIRASGQRIGFIGAMTNLHFCESCNKLRLTADGKLRPCLGSHLEFDIKALLRSGADDEALRQFFRQVVALKPKEHDFRNNYQPGRRMIAIGG